jgi:hypothetical protein
MLKIADLVKISKPLSLGRHISTNAEGTVYAEIIGSTLNGKRKMRGTSAPARGQKPPPDGLCLAASRQFFFSLAPA